MQYVAVGDVAIAFDTRRAALQYIQNLLGEDEEVVDEDSRGEAWSGAARSGVAWLGQAGQGTARNNQRTERSNTA